MPRPAINDYIFYKIVNVNGDIDLCYVGSTANWKQRQIQHKHVCNNPNTERHNLKVYKTIRENGGWEEFKMIEIARGEQLTLTEAHKKEEEYRIELKANMNSKKCYGAETLKEYTKQYNIDNADKIKKYKIDNADKIKEYRINNVERDRERARQYYNDNADKYKQYRIDNADKIKERRKQYHIDNADKIKAVKYAKHTCDCGSSYSWCHKSRHLKSKKHQKYVESLNQS